ncbi:MAG: hypothetical protein JW864_18355 [Spirochaetes bacterium]|nr:hypothetical protein [Spirochaetota bacterium]
MKMQIFLSFIIIFSLLFLFSSCSKDSGNEDFFGLNPEETFEDSDVPVDYTYDSLIFTGPWGYDKPENTSRQYPLLVSGAWNEGAGQYSSVNQRYPAFVVTYQKNTESDGRILGQWIKGVIDAGYRIDVNRIYLTGFSMGGSGSFPLAKGMHAEGLYFAAIIRVAGQSQSDLTNEIAGKTALWYHIGLSDNTTRVEVARKTLENFREYTCNSGAVESAASDSVTGYDRTTVLLQRSGYPMFLYSEYTGMGHTSSPCYKDEALFPWMFNHSLKYR